LLGLGSGQFVGRQRHRQIAIAIASTTLVLTALFLAQGTMRLIGAAALPLDPSVVEPASSAGAARASATRERKDPASILRRNIFDSELGDMTRVAATEPEVEPDGPVEDVDADGLPRCDGAVRLVGSMFNPSRPDWSFAAITGASGKALLYRAGMEVEGRTVLAINPSSVVMRPSSGSPCKLAMFDPSQPRTATAPTPAARATSRARDRDREEAPDQNDGTITTAEMESGITRNSDTSFTVARNLVDKLLENQAELMRTARIIPHEENGRTVGVKLYGIRRNSLLGRLGLQNGDMLRTINGYDMTSPDSALEAYARLRGADNLTVSLVRRGQATTIDYGIQ
jgi:general secretion pathway protein C